MTRLATLAPKLVLLVAGVAAVCGCDLVLGLERSTLSPPETQANCGTVDALADGFEDEHLGDVWFAQEVNGSVTVDGQLELHLNGGVWANAEIWSRRAYDLRNRRVYLRVPESIPDQVEWAFLKVLYDENEQHVTVSSNGRTIGYSSRVGQSAAGETIEYNPAEYRWWSIAERNNAIYVDLAASRETLGSGQSWKATDLLDANLLWVHVGAQGRNDTTIRFDDLNQGVPLTGHCAASSFEDDFEQQHDPRAWVPSTKAECTHTEGDGLTIGAAPGGEELSCEHGSAAGYDLRGSEAVVQVGDVPDTAGGSAFLAMSHHQTAAVQLVVEQASTIKCVVIHGQRDEVCHQTYLAGEHSWWKIAEQDGTVLFHASPDGRTWNELGSASQVSVPLHLLQIQLGVSAAAGSGPVSATFRYVNLAPR